MYTERTQQFLRKKKFYLKKPKRLEGLRPRNTSAAPAIATSASTTTTARVWPVAVVAKIVARADPIIFQWLFFLNLKIKLIKKENTKNKVLLLFPDQQQRSRESRTWRCLWRLLYRLPSVHNQHIGGAELIAVGDWSSCDRLLGLYERFSSWHQDWVEQISLINHLQAIHVLFYSEKCPYCSETKKTFNKLAGHIRSGHGFAKYHIFLAQ